MQRDRKNASTKCPPHRREARRRDLLEDEGGADIRFIQAMLGHSNLRATETYTQVSIRKLKDIHTATHPGAALKKTAAKENTDDEHADATALLDALAHEADEEPE